MYTKLVERLKIEGYIYYPTICYKIEKIPRSRNSLETGNITNIVLNQRVHSSLTPNHANANSILLEI